MTICSYDNSGQIKFDVDIEMEQGYWNTSTSRLWTKIRDWMHNDLVEIYKDLRQNGLSYETLMKYFYDEQIAKIPQTYYNNDCDVKYIPYANEYIGKAHGDGYEHLKRWLKRRIIFCDTLFDYSPSYTNDVLTIRANTTETMTLEIETYTPVYQHLSWYNNQMDKKKIDGKTSVTFTGNAQASTDQEVLIYGGSNIKSIKGISTMNPNQMLIGSATRLIELEARNCPLLTDINSNKANLSPHSYLNKVDLSGCSQLGGALRLNNSPLIRDINMKGTVITSVQMPTSVRNLEVLRLPNTIPSLTLQDASLLNTLEFDEGMSLQSISLTNCNNLTNTINFDLTKTPTVYLDNSYNAEELYMSDTTNLTLRNMSKLERVIYIPNNQYETFDIDSVINGSNYEVHTFNNPNMTEFITTAPHRESYNNGDYGDITPDTVFSANTLDLSDTQFTDIKFLCTTDLYNLKVPTTMKNFYCDSAMDIDTEVITDASYEVIHDELIEPYTTNYEGEVVRMSNEPISVTIQWTEGTRLNYSGGYGETTGGMISQYTKVIGGTTVSMTIEDASGGLLAIAQYDENKTVLEGTYTYPSWVGVGKSWEVTLNENTKYIRISKVDTVQSVTSVSVMTTYTPNIIPSSANGSLIFNMYSNNTTQPTSTSPYMWDLTGLKLNDFYTFGMNNWVKQDTEGNITMPQRLPGYSVRMVNADITPNNYATHLYPLLVDTTLPITGKLDYTKYNGTTLAWAYAYTTNDVAINPLGSQQQGNITNDYNKLYGTNYIDIVDVWAHKDDDFTNRNTNENITKAYIELTSANYTTRIDEVLQWYPNCTDVYLFDDGSVTTLLSLYDVNNMNTMSQVYNVYFMEGYFTNLTNLDRAFRHLDYAVSVNNIPNSVTTMKYCFEFAGKKGNGFTITNLPNSLKFLYYTFSGSSLISCPDIPEGVTDMYGCFGSATRLNQQFDLTHLNISNDGLNSTFNGCSSLTYTPILPSNYTGSMETAFQKCSKLVEAPVLPNGVTALKNAFNGCTSLTTVPNIPSACTNYEQTFSSCSSLTSVPQDGWKVNMRYTFQNCTSLNQQINISSASNLESTFSGCTSLSITPNLPSTANCTMEGCFYNCTALISPPITPEGIAKMNNCYRNCSSLTKAPIIPDSCTNVSGICYNTKITSITFPLTNVISYADAFNYCTTTIDITWKGLRNTDFSFATLGVGGISYRQEDIHELVPEHLADVTEEGTTATLTLGDYGTYLSPDEVFLANEKGWTIEGTSSDFTIINASDDVSGLTTDENVLSCFIELTSDNYKTRNNEVLQHYPNCTDVYYFDDGSITTLYNMFSGGGGTVQNQITKMVFMEGYFENITILDRLTWYNENLRTLDIRGLNSGKVTSMGAMCMSLNNLTELIGFEDFDLSIVNTMRQLIYHCNSFNQHLDLSTATSLNSTGLENAFEGCSSLTYTPILPSNYIGSMANCFDGCSKLVEAPAIPDGVTNMSNTFKNCSKLTSSPTLPNGVTNMNGTFYGCKALANPPIIPDSVTNLYGAFLGCESLTTCPTIPNGVTNMGSTFYSCPNITTPPTIPDSVTNISGTFQNCSSLTTAPTIPNSVSNMDNTFRGCTSLTTAPDIPSSVTSMANTFYGCTALLNGAILHENVTDIGYLYINCTSLKTAQIPVNATWGGYYPLQNCSSLEDITWVGRLNKDYSVPNLGWLGTNKYITQEDIKELVPEHLDDLYKDTIKLNRNDTKITINDNEIIYIESARYVEYIQGDGNDYIDIDIYANPQWKYELTRSGTDTSYAIVFDAGDFTRFKVSSAYQSTLMYNNKDFNYDHNLNTDTSIYTVTIDKNKCYENGELKATITETNDTTQFTKGVRLFKTFQSRTDIYAISKGKLYSFKMWDENGTLQFDGRPCLVNEKYPCIYDEVSKKFFFPQS